MSRFAASLLAVALAATVGTTSAQDYSTGRDYGTDRSYSPNDGDRIAPLYEYAEVVRVDPIIARGERFDRTDDRNCYREGSLYTGRDGGDARGYDDRYGDRYDDRYDDRYAGRDDGRYRSNDPWRTYDGYDRSREERTYGTQTGRNVATVLGGIVGAALGSKVGGGSARYATAAVGSMVGGMAGREIYESNQRQRQASVTVCDMVDARDYREAEDEVAGYDVTYVYGGRQYTTRTDHHPGDRIRVRVDVRAE
ncbi:MAG TPA: glycine zipper 2TM domain-containing protein [Xanthomonadaceae bacterium]